MPTYHAQFTQETPDGTYWIEEIVEELEEKIADIEHFEEFVDSENSGGELCISFSFSFEIGTDIEMPRGRHPHYCQADCSYCYALEGYDEALEREVEGITEGITKELVKVEGFDELVFIND